MQRRDGDAALRNCMQIRAAFRVFEHTLESDPKVSAPPRIHSLIHAQHRLIALALRSYRDACDAAWRQRGEIDVQQDGLRPADLNETTHQWRPMPKRTFENCRSIVTPTHRLTHCDRGNTQHGSF